VPFEQNHPPVPLTHANRAPGTLALAAFAAQLAGRLDE
jgi:hypothetical protein